MVFFDLYSKLKVSLAGLYVALDDRSFRLEIISGFFIFPVLIYSKVDLCLKLLVACTYVFLISLELLNTSLERLCDRITFEFDLQIKAVKDIASGAVFLLVILLSLQIVFVFWKWFV